MIDETLLEELKAKHVGKWLAVKNGEVLAVAESHEAVYQTLKGKNWDGAYVFYSPTEEDRRRHYLFEAAPWT